MSSVVSSHHKCGVCGSEDTERLTGEDVDFIGRLTVFDKDEEYGWTYLGCDHCWSVMHFWHNIVVDWDLSQIDKILSAMGKGEDLGKG